MGEAVEAADRDQGPAGRAGRQGRVLLVALPQGDEEGGDVLLTDLGDRADAGPGEVLQIAVQVAAIGQQRVAGRAALDDQMVEIAADGLRQRGGQRRVGQRSTSSRARGVAPCASATGP